MPGSFCCLPWGLWVIPGLHVGLPFLAQIVKASAYVNCVLINKIAQNGSIFPISAKESLFRLEFPFPWPYSLPICKTRSLDWIISKVPSNSEFLMLLVKTCNFTLSLLYFKPCPQQKNQKSWKSVHTILLHFHFIKSGIVLSFSLGTFIILWKPKINIGINVGTNNTFYAPVQSLCLVVEQILPRWVHILKETTKSKIALYSAESLSGNKQTNNIFFSKNNDVILI